MIGSEPIDGLRDGDRWTTTVGAICDQFGGEVQTGPFGSQLHASDYCEDGTPVVMPQDMGEGRIVCDRIARVDSMRVEQLARHKLKVGDVIFSRRGDVTRFAVVTTAEDGWLCGTGSIRIRLNCPDINIGYVRRYFQRDAVGTWLRHHAKGVTMPNLNTEIVRALPFAYPPLAEQRRIAEVLDRAEALRAKRRAALAQLDTLTQAIFLGLFGDHRQTAVTVGADLKDHPLGWRWELLTDVARLATGHTPDRKRPDYWNGDIPWITLSEIRRLDGAIAESTDECITQAGINNSSAVKLPARTVCFSRTASVGFVTVTGREMATSQDFVNWVCGPRLDPTYLMHALLRSRERIRSLSTGSTHKTIYFPTVEQFKVLVPPLPLQREFARRVAAVEKLKAAQRASLAEMDALFASLQHRAFRGEL